MLFLISYFSGIRGSSTSEWANDKFHGLEDIYGLKNFKFFTSIESNLNYPNVYKIPSISYKDFKIEIRNKKINFRHKLYFLISCTLGIIIDFILKIFIKGISESRWSWSISSFLYIFFHAIAHKPNVIISTGGAASAHLSACFLKFFFKFKLIIELQDPLVGDSIGRNKNAKKYFLFLEKFFISKADKIIFVTQKARKECIDRHFFSKKIQFLYPGSRKFRNINYKLKNNQVDKLKFLHLGTLYGSRNFNNLFQALDELIREKKLNIDDFEIHNVGDIYLSQINDYNKKKYFSHESSCERLEAFKKISNHNIFLLIQHTDERSKITIPFKFYDYLNFDIPIFALTNNIELDTLIKKTNNYFANINSVNSIKTNILYLKNNINNLSDKVKTTMIFDQKKQLKKLIYD